MMPLLLELEGRKLDVLLYGPATRLDGALDVEE
jgi:hypothetical protein